MADDADQAWRAAVEARVAALRARPPLPADEAAITLAALLADSLEPAAVLAAHRAVEAVARPQPVAVWGGAHAQASAMDLARLRFGAGAHLVLAARPEDALAQARAGGVAVLALDPVNPWWGRLLAQPDLSVFAALPELSSQGPCGALAVAAVGAGPTGNDQTFWVTDDARSPAAIEALLAQDGLAADLVISAGGLKLFALAGYVQVRDERLARAPGRLSGVIGAAPMPFAV